MGFRNIMISSNMKLRIQDQQLVVTAGDEVHIPLEDINCILIENQSICYRKLRIAVLRFMSVMKNICQMQCYCQWCDTAVILKF
mgnify:CR=1 FL=1